MPTVDLRDILAENILTYRHRKKISQDEFAAQSGLHRTYIGGIERSERNVTLATLEMVAKTIGCTVPNILTKGGV